MLWVIFWISWVGTVVCAFLMGYLLREIRTRLVEVNRIIHEMGTRTERARQVEVKKRPSFIDADDVVTQVRMEHAERMKILNPNDDDRT